MRDFTHSNGGSSCDRAPRGEVVPGVPLQKNHDIAGEMVLCLYKSHWKKAIFRGGMIDFGAFSLITYQ